VQPISAGWLCSLVAQGQGRSATRRNQGRKQAESYWETATVLFAWSDPLSGLIVALTLPLIPFGLAATRRSIAKAFGQGGVSGEMVLRKRPDGHVFVTDGGHWIVDAHLGKIEDAPRLANLLGAIPGVVEHGLFIGLTRTAILAGGQGIRVVERP